MALTKVTGQVIKNTTDVTVGVLTVTNTLAVGGTVSIGGTLTYEDVTNVDAVGLITARNGIVVGSGITLSKDGDVFFTGIATGNGSGLTDLNATQLTSGTVPTARLGSGTASSSTFLRGDSTFAAVTSTTINNNADNRLITGSGTANTLNGESGFTFNGSLASIANSSGSTLEITTNTGAADATLRLSEGAAGSTSNGGGMFYSGADNKLHITCGTDSTTKRITINRDDGLVGIGTVTPASQLHIAAGASGDCQLILETDPDNNEEADNSRILFRQDGGQDQTAIGVGGTSYDSTTDNALCFMNSVPTSGGIIFKTGSASGYTNATAKVKITTDGNVLIGTTTETDNLLYLVKDHTEAFVNPSDSIMRIENSNTSGTTGQASISFTAKTTGANADSAIVSQAEASGDSRLEFWTDTGNGMTEKMSINHDGHVLKPSNVSFCIYSAGPQTFSNGMVINTNSANTSQPWHNVGGHWSTGNDEFTAPVTGRYMMTLSFTFWFESDHSSDGWDVTVERNTGSGYNNVAEYYFGGGQASGYEDRCNVEGIWYLNAGDKIRYTAGGYAGSGNFQQKVFTGYLMG